MNRVIIKAGFSSNSYLEDIWKYRELLYVLSWRDILVRYSQTFIGLAWALIRPLLTIFAFTFVFSKLAGLPSAAGIPYLLMVCAAILPWQMVSNGVLEASNSLIANENLMSKIYFPRIIIPISAIVVSFIDFIVGFTILFFLFFWYGVVPTAKILLLPFAIFLTFFAAIGPGLILSALNVKFKDVRYAIPFLLQIWIYISPVGFSSEIVPNSIKYIFYLNPLSGIIDLYRWILFPGPVEFNFYGIAISMTVIFATLIFGFFYFRKRENTFVDLI